MPAGLKRRIIRSLGIEHWPIFLFVLSSVAGLLSLLPERFLRRPHAFSFKVRFLLLNAAVISSVSCQSASRPAIAPPKDVETKVTFVAVGDIMLSRGVARVMDRAKDPLLPFKKLEAILKSTDFNFGNLESPFSGNDKKQGHDLIFNVHTRDMAGLTQFNFKVLNLANNHAFDQNVAGLQNTRRYLKDHEITFLGTGDNLEEAWQPKVITVNDLKLGFIGASYASVNDGGVARNDYVARIEDVKNLKRAIAQLKSEADFIVVTMHAGTEFVAKPDPRRTLDKGQIDFAHTAIDYGADLVIGAHPHWIQNFETYSGKYIFYSLGNFIFDMHDPIANEGLVLKITLRGEKRINVSVSAPNGQQRVKFNTRIEQIECLPVIIENYSTPRLASETETSRILTRMGLPRKLSNP
jgi:gamma-polyglutamate biosynthesis protein CapA